MRFTTKLSVLITLLLGLAMFLMLLACCYRFFYVTQDRVRTSLWFAGDPRLRTQDVKTGLNNRLFFDNQRITQLEEKGSHGIVMKVRLRDTLLQRAKSHRWRIMIELEEADVCQHIDRLRPVLRLLSALGCRFAVSQAGWGSVVCTKPDLHPSFRHQRAHVQRMANAERSWVLRRAGKLFHTTTADRCWV